MRREPSPPNENVSGEFGLLYGWPNLIGASYVWPVEKAFVTPSRMVIPKRCAMTDITA